MANLTALTYSSDQYYDNELFDSKEVIMADLTGKKVAILVDNYFEEAELRGPRDALEKAGAKVDIIAADGVGWRSTGPESYRQRQQVRVDKTLDEATITDYDALVLPGGAMNADQLRMKDKAREWIKTMVEQRKPLAVICHAPWVLASAGVAKGRKLTSFFTIQDDMRDAGADWVDQEVVVDGTIITSRKPDDILRLIVR